MEKNRIIYKLGDIIVWEGGGRAIIRILTLKPHDSEFGDSIDPTATDVYNSLHLNYVRFATKEEIELLGQEDFLAL